MLIVDMPSPFDKDGYPNCNTCELRHYCQKPELIDCPIKGEVVRCKDCKHADHKDCADGFCWCDMHGGTTDNFYCADGERKDDDGDAD